MVAVHGAPCIGVQPMLSIAGTVMWHSMEAFFVTELVCRRLLTLINAEATSNFERPFTPRTWLRSASNFGKMRFRRFATFDFSTPKKKKLTKSFGSEICFSSFLVDLGGARRLLTSKSDSLTNFASGTQIFRSV